MLTTSVTIVHAAAQPATLLLMLAMLQQDQNASTDAHQRKKRSKKNKMKENIPEHHDEFRNQCNSYKKLQVSWATLLPDQSPGSAHTQLTIAVVGTAGWIGVGPDWY